MKFISKTKPPVSFTQWLSDNDVALKEKIDDPQTTGDNIWSFFKESTKVYDELKNTLIKDQGFICCYCGKRIEDDHNTSVEHLLPKKAHKALTLNFENLLASCKGGSKNKVHSVNKTESLSQIALNFGVDVEHLEDVYVHVDEIELFRKRYDLENLKAGDKIVIFPQADSSGQHCDVKKGRCLIDIHPLQSDCDQYFSYSSDGKIVETNQNEKTVTTLGLNSNRYLNQLRSKVQDVSFLLKEELIKDFEHSPLEFEKNRLKLIQNLNDLISQNGIFDPFVFVTIWNLNN